MAKYWFKPRKFGWGVTPISIEGWLLTLMLMAILFADAAAIYSVYPPFYATLKFLVDTVIITFLFLLLIKNKIKGSIGI